MKEEVDSRRHLISLSLTGRYFGSGPFLHFSRRRKSARETCRIHYLHCLEKEGKRKNEQAASMYIVYIPNGDAQLCKEQSANTFIACKGPTSTFWINRDTVLQCDTVMIYWSLYYLSIHILIKFGTKAIQDQALKPLYEILGFYEKIKICEIQTFT